MSIRTLEKQKSGYSKFAVSFAILYCLIFLNVFQTPNEIWPYYSLVVLTQSRFRIEEILLYLTLGIFSIIATFHYEDTTVFYDLVYLFIIIRTCFALHYLRHAEKLVIGYIFEIFIIISIVFGVLQLRLPFIMELTYFYFSGRPDQSIDLLINTRQAALLIGPEPAYTGVHLISMLLFINTHSNRFTASVIYTIILVILTKSIVVIFAAVCLLTYISFLHRRKLIMYLMGVVLIFVYGIYFEFINSLLERFAYFVTKLVRTGSLLEAEAALGSIRLQQIFKTQLQIFIFDYSKPFSVFGTFSTVLMSPIFATITLAIVCKIFHIKFKIFPFIFVFLFGPVLLWPILYSLLSGKSNASDNSVTLSNKNFRLL
jgi:hypothetical protein